MLKASRTPMNLVCGLASDVHNRHMTGSSWQISKFFSTWQAKKKMKKGRQEGRKEGRRRRRRRRRRWGSNIVNTASAVAGMKPTYIQPVVQQRAALHDNRNVRGHAQLIRLHGGNKKRKRKQGGRLRRSENIVPILSLLSASSCLSGTRETMQSFSLSLFLLTSWFDCKSSENAQINSLRALNACTGGSAIVRSSTNPERRKRR